MDGKWLVDLCLEAGIDFFTGVPDSQLKGLCDTLYATFGTNGKQHIVAANEGNALALAAGHTLATGRPALCYMQNSGLGNAVNPLASLMDGQVYRLPCLLVIGWRGEPDVKDEPQHVTQGAITLGQLDLLNIPYLVIDPALSDDYFLEMFQTLLSLMAEEKTVALVVRKGALTCETKPTYTHEALMSREEATEIIVNETDAQDVLVSTTGKLSRELFEIRERQAAGHRRDFLTVGSMGHASSIALGIALEKPHRRVWCLDGDGAALMHLGALAVMGQQQPKNLIHIVMNNGAHETVGGMPVNGGAMLLSPFAKAAGYPLVLQAQDEESLRSALTTAKAAQCLAFIEVHCALGARADLGRPTTTPLQNRNAFMAFLQEDA